MIEIKKPHSGNDYQVFVDGVLIEAVTIYHYQREGVDSVNLRVGGYENSKKIAAHRLSEFPSFVDSLVLTYWLEWADLPLSIDIQRHSSDQSHKFLVSFIGYASWRGAYSLAEYLEELREVILEAEHSEIGMSDAFPHDFEFINIPLEKNIADEIARFSDILRPLSEEAKRRLDARIRENTVVMHFDFPEEVKVPCEQYLLYFVDFLKGLGVKATADLQHEAGRVLFAVTPSDKTEALDKIHTALRMYLQLAASPINDAHDPEDEIAVQRLLANVDHLKSQLRLSYMMVRAQETTIQAQQTTIENQQHILSGKVLLDSLKTDTPNREDKEEVIDGILALGKYEDKGVIVNFGELYRRIKQLFKKEE